MDPPTLRPHVVTLRAPYPAASRRSRIHYHNRWYVGLCFGLGPHNTLCGWAGGFCHGSRQYLHVTVVLTGAVSSLVTASGQCVASILRLGRCSFFCLCVMTAFVMTNFQQEGRRGVAHRVRLHVMQCSGPGQERERERDYTYPALRLIQVLPGHHLADPKDETVSS